jgi:hypothetical protein
METSLSICINYIYYKQYKTVVYIYIIKHLYRMTVYGLTVSHLSDSSILFVLFYFSL